ncbi:hypothetical protein [Pseudomonas sp. AE27]|uniref:hypothetical protein n=1 Tax=Pseudomonas sp. AE27 TaxID=3127460 RepID=UPI0030CEEFC4
MEEAAKPTDIKAGDLKLILALGALALIALVFVFTLYRLNFGGDLSPKSSEWSNFGGYFGGVLVPIVSVLTLVTVFKTVLLQREMLQLQDATFRSQTRQAAALAADAEKSRIDYRKSALMGFADKLVLSLAKEMESTRGACFEAIKVMNSMADIEEVRKLAEGVTKLQGQLDKMDDKRLSLQRLMFSILNRPWFPRHSPSSGNSVSHTLLETAA